MSDTPLLSALDHPAFSELDRHFARLIERLSGGSCPDVALAAALASHFRDAGHSCVDLKQIAGATFPGPGLADSSEPPFALPPLEPWVKSLRAVDSVGAPREFKPLILDSHGRLYLHRYWNYEAELAEAIRKRSQMPAAPLEPDRLSQALRRVFPTDARDGEPEWQQVAVFTALTRRLCVISGGPGTGKTHTAALVLAALLECSAAGEPPPRIALAAPTGKAAMRLEESVANSTRSLGLGDSVQQRLSIKASTIHRLLGVVPGSPRFRHDAANPLPFDVIVVDEASMVDLALMARLVAAVRPDAGLILLGDRDQLASVEAGAVLGDLCHGRPVNGFSPSVRDHYRQLTGTTLPTAAEASPSPLGDCIVLLDKSHRFESGSRIQEFGRAINAGDAARARGVAAMENSGVELRLTPAPGQVRERLRPEVIAAFTPVMNAASAADALAALGRFRILCALRRGPFGVQGINPLVEQILAEAGLIRHRDPFYRGRPVLILQNDYDRRLFNGDLGIVWPDPANGKLATFFPGPEGALRAVSVLRLPRHETAFAMTVHKCQGSEFEKVLFLLPDRESPILTRELVYTGVTRARRQVELWMEEQIFAAALARRTLRASGMLPRLWETAG